MLRMGKMDIVMGMKDRKIRVRGIINRSINLRQEIIGVGVVAEKNIRRELMDIQWPTITIRTIL